MNNCGVIDTSESSHAQWKNNLYYFWKQEIINFLNILNSAAGNNATLDLLVFDEGDLFINLRMHGCSSTGGYPLVQEVQCSTEYCSSQ